MVLYTAHQSNQRSIAVLRDERRGQAKLTFFAALLFSIFGVTVIFAGVGMMLSGDATISGAITSASGVVSGAISRVFFKLNKDANDRFDAVMQNTQKLEKAQFALDMASKITNDVKRDAAIVEAMRKL